jgi:quinol monooxygenase YgiN
MIHVIAIITAQPGLRDSLLEVFRANVPNVLAEAGCIEYGATIDHSPAFKTQTEFGPDTFVVVEKWADQAAVEAHSAAPHMLAYVAKTRDLVARRVIHILSPV